ncbi:hypothetical protein HGRIS_003033 [Hohenbuehelia grisea]|uniref:F-box domain-containing protein n=1 Tax=Hohenbuehelia grisea TaxID=104357 RepID=A0ABR3JM87_9AGAR
MSSLSAPPSQTCHNVLENRDNALFIALLRSGTLASPDQEKIIRSELDLCKAALEASVLPNMSHLALDQLRRTPADYDDRNALASEDDPSMALLASQIRLLDAVLSPVRRLPPEILAEVFSQYVLSCEKEHSCVTEHGPWLLGRISSYWRAVVLGTPNLWRCISLISSLKSSRMMGSSRGLVHAEYLLKRYIEHSKGCTRLRVLYTPFGRDIPLLTLLLEQSARWESADLDISATTLHQIVTSIGPLDFQRLRALKLFLRTPSTEAIDIDCVQAFRDVPALDSFELHTGVHLDPLPLFPLPAGLARHLKNLEFSPFYLKRLQHILPSLESLEGLTFLNVFDGIWREISRDMKSIQLCLPRLRHLHVGGGSKALQLFTLPALETLDIWSESHICFRASDDIIAFLSRSKCTLTELKITNIDIKHPGFPSLLAKLTNLVTLHLNYPSCRFNLAQVLTAMTYPEGNPEGHIVLCPMPKLKHIKICNLVSDANCLEAFIAFAESRRRTDHGVGYAWSFSQLSSAEIEVQRPKGYSQIVQKLNNLRVGGLDCSWRFR